MRQCDGWRNTNEVLVYAKQKYGRQGHFRGFMLLLTTSSIADKLLFPTRDTETNQAQTSGIFSTKRETSHKRQASDLRSHDNRLTTAVGGVTCQQSVRIPFFPREPLSGDDVRTGWKATPSSAKTRHSRSARTFPELRLLLNTT